MRKARHLGKKPQKKYSQDKQGTSDQPAVICYICQFHAIFLLGYLFLCLALSAAKRKAAPGFLKIRAPRQGIRADPVLHAWQQGVETHKKLRGTDGAVGPDNGLRFVGDTEKRKIRAPIKGQHGDPSIHKRL
jgi:hypothetical protein